MSDRIASILLAAGGSARLGSAKQLIAVDGEPLVARVARVLVSLDIGPVGVVIGGRADVVRPALTGVAVQVIENPGWAAGIGTSIRAGIGWAMTTGSSTALIALCDQPEVDVGHLRALLASRGGADAVVTAYAGTLGVPAVFAAQLFDRLLTLPDDRGAKGVFGDPALDVRRVRFEGAEVDLDTRDDVARWQRAGKRSGDPRTTGFSP